MRWSLPLTTMTTATNKTRMIVKVIYYTNHRYRSTKVIKKYIIFLWKAAKHVLPWHKQRGSSHVLHCYTIIKIETITGCSPHHPNLVSTFRGLLLACIVLGNFCLWICSCFHPLLLSQMAGNFFEDCFFLYPNALAKYVPVCLYDDLKITLTTFFRRNPANCKALLAWSIRHTAKIASC